MKVKKTIATDRETSALIEIPEIYSLPQRAANQLKRDIGDFLVESILNDVADARSPVAGEDWPALSKEYKEKKKEEGAAPIANMSEHGDMLRSLDFGITDDGIRLGVFGKEALKADGHWKFSGKEGTAPQRRAVPGEGQEFRSEIASEVESMVREAIASEVTPSRELFEGIDTAAEFWSAISETFPGLSKTDVAFVIRGTRELEEFFDDLDLLRFLE